MTDTTESTSDLTRLSAALDAITPRLLEACDHYVRERTVDAFKAWLTVNAEFVQTHRLWWALAMPSTPYDDVFAPLAEPPHDSPD
jgi:hypothetical protein